MLLAAENFGFLTTSRVVTQCLSVEMSSDFFCREQEIFQYLLILHDPRFRDGLASGRSFIIYLKVLARLQR